MIDKNNKNRILLDLSKPVYKENIKNTSKNVNNFNVKKQLQINLKIITVNNEENKIIYKNTIESKKITNANIEKKELIKNKKDLTILKHNNNYKTTFDTKKTIKDYEKFIPLWYKFIKEKQNKNKEDVKNIINKIINTTYKIYKDIILYIKKVIQYTTINIIKIYEKVKKVIAQRINYTINNIKELKKKLIKKYTKTVTFTTKKVKTFEKKANKQIFNIQKISKSRLTNIKYLIKKYINKLYHILKDTYNKIHLYVKNIIILITPKNKIIRNIIISFIIIIIIITFNTIQNYNKIITLKNTIIPLYKLSLTNIANAKNDIISHNIIEAQKKIEDTQNIINQINIIFNNFKSISTYTSVYLPVIIIGDKLINISFELINISTDLANVLKELYDIKINTNDDNNKEKINKIFLELDNIKKSITHIRQKLSYIPLYLIPDEYKNQINKLIKDINDIEYYINIIDLNKDIIKDLLGMNRPMTYMIILQNNNEIRPTGGFIGSIALINTNNANINIEFKDIYDYDGQFKKFIEAPEILKNITPNFSLRDANFYPDFEISAKQINWFFENSGGYSLDFIISVNQNILKDILDITGPIYMPQYNITVDSNNYLTLLMLLIESKYISTYPKQILFDLAHEILQILESKEKMVLIPKLIEKSIIQRDIQIYSNIPRYQKLIQQFNVSGNILFKENPNIDFSSIIITSISGNKSDRYIENNIYNNTVIAKEGSIFNTIKYSRKHKWTKEDEIKIKELMNQLNIKPNEKIIDILGRGKNITYIRFYLPLNTSILSTNIDPQNYKITNELGYTVFSTISEIKPGETDEIEISYTIQKKLFTKSKNDTYHYYYQKQSGLENINFIKQINIPNNIIKINNDKDIIIKENLKSDLEMKVDLQLKN